MRLCERLGRARVMPEMRVDAISPVVRRRDRGHGPVDLTHADLDGINAHHRTVPDRADMLAPAELDIVGATVGGLDQQVVPVVQFVR